MKKARSIPEECRIYQAMRQWSPQRSNRGVVTLAKDMGMPIRTLKDMLLRRHKSVPTWLFSYTAQFFKRAAAEKGWKSEILNLCDPWEIEKEWRRLWKPW